MLRIVADVGGTNTRAAVVAAETNRPGRPTAYRNDDFSGIESVLDAFIAALGGGQAAEIVITVAGPVVGPTARLTNRDWHFDRAALSRRFHGARIVLMNDLTAFGLALQHLGPGSLETIDAGPGGVGNQQRLVINIGTGFNVSAVTGLGAATVCAQSEVGHASLPGAVGEALRDVIGAQARDYPTIEDLFSGRGWPRFQADFLRHRGRPGQARTAAADRYAELIAALSRDLALSYMPLAGVFFTGGVAREVLGCPARARFVACFRRPFPVVDGLATIPVSLIIDDAAALEGCAHALTTR